MVRLNLLFFWRLGASLICTFLIELSLRRLQEDVTITDEKGATITGWYIGNLLFGGLIGLLIVDPADKDTGQRKRAVLNVLSIMQIVLNGAKRSGERGI